MTAHMLPASNAIVADVFWSFTVSMDDLSKHTGFMSLREGLVYNVPTNSRASCGNNKTVNIIHNVPDGVLLP
mgnify:CR=1 FL=1